MSRLPTSGTIGWNDVQNSFGGSNPIGINEYYRNGSYVQQTALNNNIPTSGSIAISNFHGADGFNGTTGSWSNGTSGGKIASFGWSAANGIGSDLGMCFTCGNGDKASNYGIYGLVNLVQTFWITSGLSNITSTNINSRSVNMSGAFTYNGNLGTFLSTQSPPSSYGSSGVITNSQTIPIVSSGTSNMSMA